MIVNKIDVTATLRSMVVGEVVTLPSSCLRAAKVAACREKGCFHVYKLLKGVEVTRYE